MTKPVPLIIGIIGIVFICIIGIVFIGVALVYWLTPAGGLPSFLPGFEAASDHFHLTHAVGLLVTAVVLFAIAILWFQLISNDKLPRRRGAERPLACPADLGRLVSGP